MPSSSMRAAGSVAVLSCLSCLVSAQGVSLTPNVSANGASQMISPSYAGMGIEPSNLFSFTGDQDTPNDLSINLLANLANYTGVPPHLRIGGNTEDYMIYDDSFDGWYIQNNPNATGQGNIASNSMTIGPGYFAAIDRFPPGTPITHGLNLAYFDGDYIPRIVAMANASRSMLKQTVLVSYEIGNEPDLYLQNGFRNGSWDATVYSSQWLDRASAVYEQVLKPYNISANFFEPACTASTIGNTFQLDQLSNTGILTPSTASVGNKTFVAAWNQHDYYNYIGVSAKPLTLDQMMDLSTTPAQFAAWATQVTEAARTNLPYVLREMASVGPVGQAGISDVFGATLWTLNFFLYAAALNISSVQMHMTDNSFASPWLPIRQHHVAPFVRTTYYAWAAMAQLIGGGCTTQVQSMPIAAFPQGYANNVIAYSSYRQNALSALIMINTKISNVSDTSKGSVPFTFNLPQHQGETLYLSYLTAAGTDATSNTTWNGISFEQSGNGKPTTQADGLPTTAQIDSSGNVTIQVRDAQAVVAAFGNQIGMGPGAMFNQSACEALGRLGAEPRPDTTLNGAKKNSGPAEHQPPKASALAGLVIAAAVMLTVY